MVKWPECCRANLGMNEWIVLPDAPHLWNMTYCWPLHCLSLSVQSTEQVTAFCRSLHDVNPIDRPMASSSSSSSSSLSPSPVSALPPAAGHATQRQLSHADKLRKVINELVETEKTYVKVSTILTESSTYASNWWISNQEFSPHSCQGECLCYVVWVMFIVERFLLIDSPNFFSQFFFISISCAFRTWAV